MTPSYFQKYHTSDGFMDHRGRPMRDKQNILSQMKIKMHCIKILWAQKRTPLGRKPLTPNAVNLKCKGRHIPDSAKGPRKRGDEP